MNPIKSISVGLLGHPLQTMMTTLFRGINFNIAFNHVHVQANLFMLSRCLLSFYTSISVTGIQQPYKKVKLNDK